MNDMILLCVELGCMKLGWVLYSLSSGFWNLLSLKK